MDSQVGETGRSLPPSVNAWNGPFLDDMHRRWLQAPADVPESWQAFFSGFELASDSPASAPQRGVDLLIDAYRRWGHFDASIDPLGRRRSDSEACTLQRMGLSESDLDRTFDTSDLPLPDSATLAEMQTLLKAAWCSSIGAETEHLDCPDRRRWWRERIEALPSAPPLDQQARQRVLLGLQQATGLERFLSRRYVGSKWFSLEGGETLIPMLDALLQRAAEMDVEEIAFGMAHRGRVNVLVNILEKSYDQLFTEFEEAWTEDFLESGGDVKYHRGYSTDVVALNGKAMHLALASNPSHLEWGHPVVIGRVRAKQRLRDDVERCGTIPVLIHGDAALPGQGVVQELANLAGLDAYDVGGSIHIVINNQIGFTAEHNDCFSGPYCTDVLRGMGVPVLHLNGHDPDMCVRAMHLALEYRQTFGSDVALDLWGYRKYGHNETDEPGFTNPTLYEAILEAEPIVSSYARRLCDEGVIDQQRARADEQHLLTIMDEAQDRIRAQPVRPTPPAFDDRSTWAGLDKTWNDHPVDTTVGRDMLERIASALGTVPEGFTPHRRLVTLLEDRRTTVAQDRPLDWAMGELLAYGSLLLEGCPIRLTGEDCQRGTFSHRHAILFDARDATPWSPLDGIDPDQARMCVHNSPVTEAACIGFEYGYSLGDPNMLVVWEAQFGDFANVGQVYFDQFLASAERKWSRHSGVVSLLPHGYEGAGPEHSSARLERFLLLCADGNMEVVVPTTPSQMFHLLRRQMRRTFRKPLIVLTPKSLLRHKAAVSSVSDLTDGAFQTVIDDDGVDPASVTTVLLCSGKVAYDLLAGREALEGDPTTAIIRIEQLFPFPDRRVGEILEKYRAASTIRWVQEEPRNAGAWTWLNFRFFETFGIRLEVISRPANASPACGSARLHAREQATLVETALNVSSTGDNGNQP